MSDIDRLRALTPPLREHIKLNLPEHRLIEYMKHYVLCMNDIRSLGFPCRYDYGAGFIRKRFSGDILPPFDVNAREFIPKSRLWNERKDSTSADSGQATESSSSAHSTDNESSDNNSEVYGMIERKCVRCYRDFHVNQQGEYLSVQKCNYHWGKLSNMTGGPIYICCKKERGSAGCTQGDAHVWDGYQYGFNRLEGFVETKPLTDEPENGHEGAYAVDCEMCYTGLGLEVTKVTVVSTDGRLIYEKFIKPVTKIVCYNTRFSGVTMKDLNVKNGSVATLIEVQQDLLKIFSAGTILIGHALENDLRSLKLIHNTIIDTSIIFPHHNGPSFKQSLKSLVCQYLKRHIQESVSGHNSFEDSRACLEIMLWRIRKDFREVIEQ